ncbi:MAG TPA: helix-turn-helix transcriptional regulator [Firmicutes bacterium]|nr:helix-turn-helix transcriptional regulator [Bacillota bacterium]HHY99420.1 helix-turn-helix transcriptional regulator [Bacillota bacterium]
MEELKRRIGSRLRALRQDRRLTQEKLAESAGIHPTFLAKIEGGRRLPSLEVICRLANALGVPAAAIVSAIDEREGASPKDRLADEIVMLLEDSTREELELVRDFSMLLLKHRDPRNRADPTDQ